MQLNSLMKTKAIYKNPAPGFRIFLVSIILLRIISYFVLSEDLIITQALKAGLRTALTIIVITSSIIQQMRSDKPLYKIKYPLPLWLYAGYLVLGIASLLWTSSFKYSLLQIFMDIESFVFAFFFMRLVLACKSMYPGGYFELHKIIAPAIALIAAWFAIGKVIDPDQYYRLTHGGEVSRLGGYIINPNELGMLLVVGIAVMLPMLIKDEKYSIRSILILGGLIYLLFLTGSRSSFISMLLVFGLYGYKQQSKAFKIALGSLLILAIPLLGYQIFVKQSNAEEVMSMTGRIPFWKDLLTYNFPREPWFGFGYMRIDYADKFESLNAYSGAMTHNTFLQVLLGLGLAGLLLVLSQLSSFLHALATHPNKEQKTTALLIFIPLLINSLTEFGIFGETNYGILFYLLIVITISIEPIGVSSRIYRSTESNAKTYLSFRSSSAA